MNKEIRTLPVELRASGDEESRTIEGVAVVFDSWSRDLGGFTEMIKRGAITQELLDNSDIVMNRDHSDDKMLARWNKGKGTLQLELKDDGLHYSFDAPNSPLGDELLEYLTRGEITTSSFAFVVDKENGDEWYRQDGKVHRNIKKIHRLYDVSPVFEPAYLETDCSKRKFDEINTIDEKLDNLKTQFENI